MSTHYSKAGYWFIAPAILLMVLILIAPVLIAAGLSFTDFSLEIGRAHV
mgnify:CR=1 FL=1